MNLDTKSNGHRAEYLHALTA